MENFDQTRRRVLASGAALLAGALLPAHAFAENKKEFRIGALNPITGAGGFYGPGMQKTILMVAQDVNAAGGAAGRMLRVFAEDCQTSPEAAALAVRKLVSVNRVEAILGTWSSGVTLATMAQTNPAGLISMNTSGATAISHENTEGLAWRFQATNERYGQGFFRAVEQEGFEKVATMALNNPSGRSVLEGFTKEWEGVGKKVVESVIYEPNRPSYRSEVQRILSRQPDAVVMGAYLPDASIILREGYQTGIPVRWLMPGFVGAPDLVKALGKEATEGVMMIDIIMNDGSAALERFNAMYSEAMGQPGSSNLYATMCYDMVLVLALAIEAAGPDASTAQVNEKIREVSSQGGTEVNTFEEGKEALKKGKISLVGASSRLNFDEVGNATQDLGLTVIEDGVAVYKGKVTV